MDKNSKICVTGATGALGRAIVAGLNEWGFVSVLCLGRDQADLRDREQVMAWFRRAKPEYVFHCAAISAGIAYRKNHPVEMLLWNAQMTMNVMEAAVENGCKGILDVGSALLYPDEAQMPLKESEARASDFAGVDGPYGLAKWAGYRLSCAYGEEYGISHVTVVPCNLFGPGSAFEGNRAGIVPSLIRRMHEAKLLDLSEVEVWGTGNAVRLSSCGLSSRPAALTIRAAGSVTLMTIFDRTEKSDSS